MDHNELKTVAAKNIQQFFNDVRDYSIIFVVVCILLGVVLAGLAGFEAGAFLGFIAVWIFPPISSIWFIIVIVGYIATHLKNNFMAQAAILEELQKQK